MPCCPIHKYQPLQLVLTVPIGSATTFFLFFMEISGKNLNALVMSMFCFDGNYDFLPDFLIFLFQWIGGKWSRCGHALDRWSLLVQKL